MNDKTVYLQAAVGEVDREIWEKVLDLLRSQGFTTLIMERHRKMKTIQLSSEPAAAPAAEPTPALPHPPAPR